jgi:quercetin dioxygenase-like cupin family protein
VDEATFREALARRGVAPLLVHWAAGYSRPAHAHAFDAHGLVLSGCFILTTATSSVRLGAGDPFELAAGIEHSEHSPDGASVLVAALAARSDCASGA